MAPNTTATLFLPKTDEGRVSEGGRPLADVAGVEHARTDAGDLMIRLQSGTYEFKSGLARRDKP